MLQVQKQLTSLCENKALQTAVMVIVPSIITYKLYSRYKRNQRRKEYQKDVVILHQYPDGQNAPSLSPWALKLETWLRMAKIPYQNEQAYEYGPKGKIPWITLNGQDMGDSQFIIEFLAKKYNVNFSSNFSATENGIARAFLKMTEESLFWIFEMDTFVLNPSPKDIGFPAILLKLAKMRITKKAKNQGYGLHKPDEVYSIGRADVKALNDFIGNKKYLLGDKVSDTDAAIFGLVIQLFYHSSGPIHRYIKNECPNVVRYLDNIKKTYWPDWSDRIRDKSQV